jgi:hypothetical protein
VPLVRTFSRLTEESARHLDTRHTAFMRLATRPEALRAAEHIGLERRFVAGRFAHTHSLSRSRTRTTSESVTHTTGSAQGESVTRTTGSTRGRAYSEAAVPRDKEDKNQNDTNDRAKRPEVDIVKTRTTFFAQHEGKARTESWTNTEETSHTRSTSQSRTDGVSVGDEISFELVYDHKVQPETLMALPEDQMLAPHITEKVTGTTTSGAALAESKLIALVIDPAVVGSQSVAAVRPDEIPAFEPPAPAVSGHVPDYDRVGTNPA